MANAWVACLSVGVLFILRNGCYGGCGDIWKVNSLVVYY